MSTFKTALRMALAHPFYLLIYTVFISLMGVFIAASVSWNSSQLTEYKPYDANVIVVDRDNSDLSRALTKHLGSRFDLVTGVGDDTYDLADALSKSNSAKGSADCVFFIPEGFEDDLVAAARAGESLPKLDVTYGAGTMAAALSSAEASRWISLAGAAAALEPTASNGDVAATLESYFNFGAYAIISSVIVSVGLVFSGMNEPERVRRMDAGPISERQRSLAVFAAAAVLTVCIWFVSSMMGVVGFAGAVAEVGVGRVCLALAATFALACTPLAVGFTLSSLGARGAAQRRGQLTRHAHDVFGRRLDAAVAHGLGRADRGALCADVLGERRDRQGARVGPDVCRVGRHRLRPGRHRALRRRHRRRRPSPRTHQIPRLAT